MKLLARTGIQVAVFCLAVLVAVAHVWYFTELNGWYPIMVLTVTIQLSVVGAGLVALRRRPESRVGLILIAWGFFVLINGIGNAESGALLYLESNLQPWYWMLLAHAMLTFPDGRTHSRAERAFVTVGYLWPLVWMPTSLFARPEWLFICPCPANPFLISADKPLVDTWFRVNNVLAVGLGLWFLSLVVLRHRRMAPPQRRSARPSLWAVGVILTVYLYQVAMDLTVPRTAIWWEILWWSRRLSTLLVPIGLLIALITTKLARADVAALLVRLRDADLAQLQSALSTLLRDPTLTLTPATAPRDPVNIAAPQPPQIYRITERGAELEKTELGDGLVMVHHRSARTEDPELFDAAVTAARMTIDNSRLNRQVQAHLAEVNASRERLVQAAEAERKKVERDLHDGAQQQLIGLGIALQSARLAVTDEHPAAPILDEATGQLRQSIDELRSLARGLRPAMLTERGLPTALAELRRRAGVPLTLTVDLPHRLGSAAETTAYFVVSEALQNAAKHAPGAPVRVEAALLQGRLRVSIQDDGPGGASSSAGSGLRGLADRVGALGGELEIHSPSGQGTTVTAWIPVVEKA